VTGIHTHFRSSRIFSLFLGVFFTGIALGPTLGGLLIRLTHNALSVFYAAAILHLIYATFLCIVIPESLSRPKMVASQARYQQGLKDLKEAREGVSVGLLARIKRLFGFLSPLMMFIPKHTEERKPLKGYKMDWNLTLVAAGFGFMAMILVGVLNSTRSK
jgi:MFS family permease